VIVIVFARPPMQDASQHPLHPAVLPIGDFMRTLVLLICSFFSLLACAETPEPPEPEFSVREVRAEFKELYERLRESHYDLYARRPKADYDALYARMRKGFDRPLTLAELQSRFQRFVAYGRIAHARIDQASEAYEKFRTGGGKAVPLQIRVVAGRVHVMSNLSGDPRIDVGDEWLELDGQPMARVLATLGRHVSADNDYMMHTLFEHRFAALLWQAWGTRTQFRAKLRKADGRTRVVTLVARSRAEMELEIKRQPPAFELDWTRREARMLPDHVAYLRPGPFYNSDEGATDMWDTRAFTRFIDTAFEDFIAAGATHLLIDLRDNPGGDNSFSDPMLAWFADRPFRFASAFRIRVSRAAIDSNAKRLPQSAPGTISHQLAAAYARHAPGEVFSFALPMAQPRAGKRFTGRVFMLINRHSYSNTANVAALAQDYHFARILGEETSDLATTYGAMEQFELSRSGTVVGFPKARIIRASGDLSARGVVPDVAIETPLLQGKEDPVLQRALVLMRE